MGRGLLGRGVLTAVAASALLVTGGCVSPAPNTTVYEAKAALTAGDALSSARTAVLSVRTFQRARLTGAALEVSLQESEQALEAVTSPFDSVQPPDTVAADRLRSHLDDLLSKASDSTRELRIAARRDDDATMRRQANDLAGTADDLERFQQEHQS